MTTSTGAGVATRGSVPRDPAAVWSGFGTLLHKELLLQTVLAEGIEQAETFQAAPLASVLRHHQVQVAAIVVLISNRTARLPQPDRFGASVANERLRVYSQRNLTEAATGARLAELHHDLAGRYFRLKRRSAAAGEDEPVYDKGLMQHAQMAWKLHALLVEPSYQNQSDRPHVRPPESDRQPPLRSFAEAAWENEGGGPRPLAS